MHGEFLILPFLKPSFPRNRRGSSSTPLPPISADPRNCSVRIDLQSSLDRAPVFTGPFDPHMEIVDDLEADGFLERDGVRQSCSEVNDEPQRFHQYKRVAGPF